METFFVEHSNHIILAFGIVCISAFLTKTFRLVLFYVLAEVVTPPTNSRFYVWFASRGNDDSWRENGWHAFLRSSKNLRDKFIGYTVPCRKCFFNTLSCLPTLGVLITALVKDESVYPFFFIWLLLHIPTLIYFYFND
jgi:hypothetical protein